jgi:hypothetical protein
MRSTGCFMAEDPSTRTVLRAAALRLAGVALAAAGLWITAEQPLGPNSRFVALPLMLLAVASVLGPWAAGRRRRRPRR